MMHLTITEVANGLANIREAIEALTEQDVLVGIPEDKAARQAAGDTGITNAALGYIHEYGVPEHNLPARGFLYPGIEDAQPPAVEILAETAELALTGDTGAVENGLNKIGILGQNAVRAKFVSNDWPPLAESTLDYHPLRKDDSGQVMTDHKGQPLRKKSRRERGRVNPLIDTQQLRKSITYVIRKR